MMSLGNDGFFLSDILNYPLIPRCDEFSHIIERCSIKELHDLFPTLVNSIFGVPNTTGWGLRTVCRSLNQQEFDCLYNFFTPLGPMFRLCYRLLNEPFKFDVPIEMLPFSTSQVLHNGGYANFYSDMINIDPCRRQIVSLSLNAFDYFMLHFLLHGLSPIHIMYPGALAAHNGLWKTLYFTLTADYLCTFLPANPESVVMPTNICGSVKTTISVPIQPIQPNRSPKYLSLSAITHNFTTNATAIRSPDSFRQHWRTESVLYLFIDIWLRHNFDECRELPSSEFIRVVRILVKQLHAFGNSAELDNTSMSVLRKLAQPMMNAQMYSFLRCIISRWPLDSSFTTVLELWLSYIQPWRYTHPNNSMYVGGLQIPHRFEQFVMENIVSYTQILVQLLPRFERIDFSSIKNIMMLYRVLKVFGQGNLSELLRQSEQSMGSMHIGMMSTPNHKPHKYSDNFNASNLSLSYRSEQSLHNESYKHLFGMEVNDHLKHLVQKMIVFREIHAEHATKLERDLRNRRKGFFKYIKWLLIHDDDASSQQELEDSKKIPDILNNMLNAVSNIFDIDLPSPEEIMAHSSQYSWDESRSYEQSALMDMDKDVSDIFPSPTIMKKRVMEVQYMGDPALIPIRSSEMAFLVRFLHTVSTKLNEKFEREIDEVWNSNGILGQLSRQVLYPPMTVRSFDKTLGFSRELKQEIGARITFRLMASYRTFITLFCAYSLGSLIYESGLFGLLILIIIAFIYIVLSSFLNDPKSS
ncbi:Sphingomyelin phosphodiesterase 4 [Pseudolycoriella hygida]|uniref:Sphingomyelin phosphodiesterase 4 n=1 Tax=Pseudolycoriella hygida TaxID=35572 RepID=A0A9Q0MWG6_9DIPT|nr:Sphingomyelin phosphodiesterase 4 [Pseudolycoriella hygida]